MAIIKAPDRAPNASLGMIDYSTTARLGEKGIDLVTEAIQRKQAEDKIKYENSKAERKQAQVNLASFDAQVQANPELLEFIKTDDGVLGDSYKRLEEGKANYQDSLILTGGASSAIASQTQAQQIRASELQADVAEFTLEQSQQELQNKQTIGTAFSKAMVTTKDEKGNETISFDPTVARNYVMTNNPQALGMLEDKIIKYNQDQLDTQIKLGTARAQILEAETNRIEQDIAKAKYQGEKKQATGFRRGQLYAEGELALGRQMSAREYISHLKTSGIDFSDSEAVDDHIKLMSDTGIISPTDTDAVKKLKAEQELAEKNYESNLGDTFTSQANLNKTTQELAQLVKGPSALQQVGEFFADIFNVLPFVNEGTLPSDFGSSRFGPTSEIMGVRSEYSSAIKGYFDVLTSANVIDRMIELKEASPTGSTGFGQISAPELDLLKATKLALSEAQESGRQVASNVIADYMYITNRILYKQFRNYATKNQLTDKQTAERLGISIDTYEFTRDAVIEFENPEKNSRFKKYYSSMGTADSSLQSYETMMEMEARGGDRFDKAKLQNKRRNSFNLTPNPQDPFGGDYTIDSLSGYYSGSGFSLEQVTSGK